MTMEVTPDRITIVIPVKNNQAGIDRYLKTFFDVTPPEFYPAQIIIVDNNSDIPVTILPSYPIDVHVIACSKPGPAAARNAGVAHATTDWILFHDSDGEVTAETISEYCTDNFAGHGAFQGMHHAKMIDRFSRFYRNTISSDPICQLDVDSLQFPVDMWQPAYLVTANCLVYKPIMEQVGGFDEDIDIVASEDVELSVRYKRVSMIGIQQNSIIEHSVDGGIEKLCDRFIRYGRGIKYIEHKHQETESRKMQFEPDMIRDACGIDYTLYSIFFLCHRLGYLMGLDAMETTTDD